MDEISRMPARKSSRPVLVVSLIAFALGAGLAGYGVWQFGDTLFGAAPETAAPRALASLQAASGPATPTPAASAPEAAQQASQAVQAAQIVAEQQGGLDQRLAAAEQRIARLDVQSQAAAGNAVRAESLLIAFSARRALERGNDLGVLGDQIRLRFGDAMPNAVQTLIAFGRRPVTLDRLVAGLDGLSPQLARPDRRLSWAQVRSELSQLFVVRHESTPSPQPLRRLERARLFLQTGRVAEAIAEVRNLPSADKAAGWIAEAERYSAAQNALDMIETAAVLEPSRLRDGAGQAMEPPPESGAQ